MLQSLADRFPDLAPPIERVIGRLFDLLPVLQRHYYHPEMKGSWSIKAVLPTSRLSSPTKGWSLFRAPLPPCLDYRFGAKSGYTTKSLKAVVRRCIDWLLNARPTLGVALDWDNTPRACRPGQAGR